MPESGGSGEVFEGRRASMGHRAGRFTLSRGERLRMEEGDCRVDASARERQEQAQRQRASERRVERMGGNGAKSEGRKDDDASSVVVQAVCQRRAAQGQRYSVAEEQQCCCSEGPITLYTVHCVGGPLPAPKVRQEM
jgi:hypothetical protein